MINELGSEEFQKNYRHFVYASFNTIFFPRLWVSLKVGPGLLLWHTHILRTQCLSSLCLVLPLFLHSQRWTLCTIYLAKRRPDPKTSVEDLSPTVLNTYKDFTKLKLISYMCPTNSLFPNPYFVLPYFWSNKRNNKQEGKVIKMPSWEVQVL